MKINDGFRLNKVNVLYCCICMLFCMWWNGALYRMNVIRVSYNITRDLRLSYHTNVGDARSVIL
jgi:hypothetical protein